MNAPYFVHEKAIVESRAIGSGTRIWAFTHVHRGAQIGSNCNIGEGCYIESHVKIGNNVVIKNNISIWDKVTIEDDCFLGPNVVLTNVLKPRAKFKKKIDEFDPTLIKKGATIGANATILCSTVIGEYAFVGAGAVVTKNVSSYAIVVGNPIRVTGYACECGEKIDFSQPCLCGLRYEYSEKYGCIKID